MHSTTAQWCVSWRNCYRSITFHLMLKEIAYSRALCNCTIWFIQHVLCSCFPHVINIAVKSGLSLFMKMPKKKKIKESKRTGWKSEDEDDNEGSTVDGHSGEFSSDWLYNTVLEVDPIAYCCKLVLNCCADGQSTKTSRPQSLMLTKPGSSVKMTRESLFNYHHSSCSMTLIPNGLQYTWCSSKYWICTQ